MTPLANIANGLQVDIFFARPAIHDLIDHQPCTWGTLFLCRTGSKKFNIRFALLAQKHKYHWNPYTGLWRNGHGIAAEEEEMFDAVGLPFIPPEDRER